MARKPTKEKLLRCSFCNRGQDEVQKLISGPAVHICNECVKLCNEILAENAKENAKFLVEELSRPAEIKARLDVAEYVGREVRLVRAGRYLKGLCPFHSEKTPSFIVFTDRGTFKCFGCGEGGDVFTYVMRRDNVEFPEALRTLAGEVGIELRGERADPQAVQRRKQLLAALAEAARLMHQVLREAPGASHARDYVAARGLSDSAVETFQLGYAPARGSPVVRRLGELGFDPEIIRASGLAQEDEAELRDYFFDRLVFPIWDRRAAVAGFGARAFGDVQPKYLNTRDSEVFTKGHQLYGHHLARDAIRGEGSVVIVEGYMDAIAAHEHGFANTVASMGTALTAEQASLLTSSGARRIILALDADTAGAAATRRGIDVLRESAVYETETSVDFRGLVQHEGRLATDIGIVELPEGEDPDSLIRHDRERWQVLVAEPTPLIDYYFNWALREYDLSSMAGRQHAARDLAPVVAELRDPTVRSNYLRRLADETGIAREQLHELTRRRRPRREARLSEPAEELATDRVEEGLLEYVLQAPPEHLEMVARLDPAYLSDPTLRHILTVVVRMIRDRGGLDLDLMSSHLKDESKARFAAIRERAATNPTPAPYASALQRAALSLRERRIKAELQDADAVSSAGDAVASSREFHERITRLARQLLIVDRAKRELSVLTSGKPG